MSMVLRLAARGLSELRYKIKSWFYPLKRRRSFIRYVIFSLKLKLFTKIEQIQNERLVPNTQPCLSLWYQIKAAELSFSYLLSR